jgi:hypothetical protein
MTITSGFFMAISLMVSIKTVFHLSTITFIFILNLFLSENKKNVVKQLMLFIIVLVVFYPIIYVFHKSTLLSQELNQSLDSLSSIYTKVITFDNIFYRLAYLKRSFYDNFVIWTLFLVGIVFCIRDLIRSKDRFQTDKLVMFSFLMLLFTLFFYRNAFPYFYVFIISPSIISSGIFPHRLVKELKKNRSTFSFLIITVISLSVLFNFFVHYKQNLNDRIGSQKEVLELIHQLFPQPVPYIDRCSMVSSFPKIGFFMSTWGMENYLKSNTPIMSKLLNNYKPVFLLANSEWLDLSLSRETAYHAGRYSLLEEDLTILKENYIHHWGIVYIAGKQFYFDSKLKSHIFQIIIPGIYTYEGDIEATIDGNLYQNEDIIQLEKGYHFISPLKFPAKIILRWGDHLYRPAKNPNTTPIFFGF